MKTLLVVLLFVTGAVKRSPAQNKTVDSLQVVLKTAIKDTDRVNILLVLAWKLKSNNPDSSIILGMQALQLAEKIKWQIGIGEAHNNIGWFTFLKGDYKHALEHYSQALAISDELEKSAINPLPRILKLKSGALGNIGVIYKNEGDYPKALDYYFKTLKIQEASENKRDEAGTLGNIGLLYSVQGDYSKALDYDFRALKLSDETADKQRYLHALMNIGIVYKQQGYYPKALDYYFKALKMAEALGNKLEMASLFNNLGIVYKVIGDSAIANGNKALALSDKYPKALDYYSKGLSIKEELGDKKGQAEILNNIGTLYIQQNKLPEADKFLNDALKLATEIKALNVIAIVNELLSEVYSKKGEWKKAYQHYKQGVTARDSMNNEEKAKNQTRLEMNYEFDKKQAAEKAEQDKKDAIATEEKQKQKNIRNSFIGGFAIVMLFSIIVFTQKKRIGKEKKRSDELLLNILPAETAEELKQTGAAKAKNYDMVTVLFSDFKDFTQASEKMSAEDLVQEIHNCYSEFDKIITKYGIEKIKTIGDSYMCAGGLPARNYTNAEDVVNAAIEIRQFIEREKEERQKLNKPYFEIRIGINTGPVVAGIVGIKKFAYDIWGDTVNIASRMESSGEAGKVNISGTTYEFVKNKFTCTYRGKIEAKNKGMMDMYFVERRE